MKSPVLHLATALLCALALGTSAAGAEIFPRPPGLEPDVRFWKRIYSEVDTRGGLIHDSRDLGVVYEVVRFKKGISNRSRERQVEKVKKKYKRVLQSLAKGKRSGLSADEARVLGLFPDGVSNATLRKAQSQLRFQLGQADRFKGGLVRAGAWEPHIRQTFLDMGLPQELAALPHVESSYTPTAYSRVGAAGLWQFTRSTGRRFMRVDHVVDERLDPHIATVAAARLLKQNHSATGTWPLAITAYNHGASGMRRASRKMGTTDIEKIVRKYKSRTFGFASRNFYVEFLAAAEVDFHSERYFGPLLVDTPVEYETIEVPFYVMASPLERALGVDQSVLRAANPALRPSIWNGAKRVPRGFELKVPRGMLAQPLAQAIAAVPAEYRKTAQTRDKYHVVRRGDTLSGISRRYGVRMSDLTAVNGLRSRNRIRVGQKIRLPEDGSGPSSGSSYKVARLPEERPSSGVYTVRRGDTLSRIATRFGLSEREIMGMNGLANRNRIYVGQQLVVDAAVLSAAPEPSAPAAPPPSAEPAATAVIEAEAPTPIDPNPASLDLESVADIEAEPAIESEPALQAALTTDTPDAPTSPEVDAVGVAPPPDSAPYGPELLADPSDYSVSPDGEIEVQAAETLGHYAEWLDLRASRLRQLNRLRFSDPLQIGYRLDLDFSKVSPGEFERRRLSHHRALQGAFFERFEIDGTRTHVTRRGDSIWYLAERKYNVPLWLLRQYNPDLDFAALSAGTKITIPSLKERSEWAG